jgi:thermitase
MTEGRSRMLVVLACACLTVMTGRAAGQAPDSWDEPRGDSVARVRYLDGWCVADEAIVILRTADALAELTSEAQARGDRVVGFIPNLRAARVVFGAKVELGRRLEEYARLDMVRRTEPNLVGSVTEAPGAPVSPDDPGYPVQWHLQNSGQSGGTIDADVDADEAWLITRGSPKVTVAVIDTGIDLDSPEFAGRLLPGWDFKGEDPVPEASSAHGTWVAGLLGANAGNSFEVAGVDHKCMILPIKAGGTAFFLFDLVQSIDFATAEGVAVISMSFGFKGQNPPPLLKEAVAAAAESGAILVAGAGNNGVAGTVDKTWPAASEMTIAVGWTDDADVRSPSSSNGNALDLVAPGVDVMTVSAGASGAPTEFFGSSAATPLVSGIVALMKSLNPALTYEQVYDLLVIGAEDQLGDPLDTPGWDPWYGHGRVNAAASLKALCGCEGGEPLIASPQALSASDGGVIAFVIDFGRDFAHQPYLTLGSATTGGPAFPFGGATLRLTPDEYLTETLGGSDGVSLIDTSGFLDSDGRARAMVIVEPLPVGSGDLTLFHQTVVLEGLHGGGPQVTVISNKTKTVIGGS